MTTEREILENYVGGGLLMQVATLGVDTAPAVCNVWYSATFNPDRLYFISHKDRDHSHNIRRDGRVAGSIVTIPLIELGQTAQGVTFKGLAIELAAEAEQAIEQFVARWPRARAAISSGLVAADATPTRLYEIRVIEWVLFDEQNYRSSPRRTVRPL